MSQIDTDAWTRVGGISNADCYAIAEDLLAIVPHIGCADTGETAQESLAFQQRHWQERGHRGAVVIFMDRVTHQDRSARTVYTEADVAIGTTCYALVTSSLFGRAIASVFMGLSPPPIPTKMYASLDLARGWIREQNRQRGGPLRVRAHPRAV